MSFKQTLAIAAIGTAISIAGIGAAHAAESSTATPSASISAPTHLPFIYHLNQGQSIDRDNRMILKSPDGKSGLWVDGGTHPRLSNGWQEMWKGYYISDELRLTKDGNFQALDTGSVRFESNTRSTPETGPLFLRVANTGELELVASTTGKTVWYMGLQRKSELNMGHSITKADAIVSPNGRYKIVFSNEGHVRIVGDTRTQSLGDSPGGMNRLMLHVYGIQGFKNNTYKVWEAKARYTEKGGLTVLRVTDGGVAQVVATKTGRIIWEG